VASPHAPRAAGSARELVFIVDPTTGALTVEGVDRTGWTTLGGGLLPPPAEVNCGRPAASAAIPLPPVSHVAGEPLLRVARIYHGSVVDGPGRRSVVQVQGCPIRCAGCYVPETHDPAGGTALPVRVVADAALDPAAGPRDGVTVLGGEPFAQAQALAALLGALRVRGVHTVVYSGYTLDALRRRNEPAVHESLALVDLLIDGPFVAALSEDAGEWRGSRNQRLIPHPGA
jgi:anaerobic ribonucleoside-triphosphate reductase activating protein